ncbi:MAG: hypothetical protein ACREI2_14035 [Nitrospiraceae bacterium]
MRMLTVKALSVTMLVAMAVMLVPFANAASEGKVLTVKGEVVAINLKVDPQIIVVKAMTQNKQELIVGATLEKGATITRGKKPVALADIKVGEAVDLTYLKNADGLVARSIHVR